MDKALEKYYKSVLKLIVAAVIFIVIYTAIKYLLPFLAPFMIAIVIAVINEPFVNILEKRFKVPRKAAAFISLLVTISILGALTAAGMVKIYNELVKLQGNVSTYLNDISNYISDKTEKLTSYYHTLPKTVTDTIDSNLKNAAPKLQSLIGSVISYVMGTVTSIPKMALYTITTLLAAYFISSDRREIRTFVGKQIPTRWSRNFSGIKTDTFTAIFGYFKALLFLMFLTFLEVSIGLFIIKADYALLMGLIVGISDAIPILGTGIIFIPWVVWHLIAGNMDMFFGLTIIYLVGVIVRQILEPKIVGRQIGLHPLATLIAMYIGLALFGVLGMFIGPISIIVLKNLQTAGVVKLWNE